MHQALYHSKRMLILQLLVYHGRVKYINKNSVGEKCNQELELELLRIDPTGSPVSTVTLQDAVHSLNTRIRNRGLSARKILFCRDQVTLKPL